MMRRWLGVLRVWVPVLLLLVGGCRGRLEESRGELAERLRALEGRNLTREAFCSEVGSEPHRVVSLGEKVYWYFHCADGKVIVALDAAALADGDRVVFRAGIRELD